MRATQRHETRALLRAHLSAATGFRHLTRHCPVCHRLLRLAQEPYTARSDAATAAAAPDAPVALCGPQATKGESPATR
ncbi:DUF6274 family protein [Streptomyces pinistramenti]|uniref:DUF6274 family protein n=1 Tax=Streptomyces pinistramenti TaxID=2884812 RepID=UPI001D06E0D8|nr:DUF6274 family protein [Streptomyces pinistramenti]MCB5910977.1 DUF6274 family protein [Streptomyces pinistramenti]